ncbi:MAG: RAMP superfamily CRISPR-associated protein [Succinivibrio sp.]
MKVIKIKLEAQQPLVITDGTTEGQSHRTLEYIPGNMILGAIASEWKRKNPNLIPDDTEEFNILFLSSKVKWGHAFPLAGEKQTVPIPFCYQKIKNHGGLPSVGSRSANKCHVLNLSSIKFDSDNKLSTLISEKTDWLQNKDEAIKLKKIDLGFMTVSEKCQPDIHTFWNMHVAIGKNRTAAEGQLFGYSALGKGTEFISEIYCDDEYEQVVISLLSGIQNLYIGHSRSAGYGKVQVTLLENEIFTQKKIDNKTAKLFLLSGYVSSRSWEQPLDNLKTELSKYFRGLQITNIYCQYGTLNGFNSLWSLPRKARKMLLQGSVIEISYDSAEEPLPDCIGGSTNEGYGRIIINPDFLNEQFVKADDIEQRRSVSADIKHIKSNIVNLLKIRTIYRIAREAAVLFVSRSEIANFIESQKKSSDISASQRGNLRNMILNRSQNEWLPEFEKILEKTPGVQWKNSEGKSPFDNGKFMEMSDIMEKFLTPKKFKEHFNITNEYSVFLGTDADSKCEELFFKEYYKQALLNLLKEWDMKAKRG